MRTTGTNSQVAHIWANQSQQHMRSGSMFFEGSRIYSYGKHYLAAEIHTQIKKSGLKTNRHYSKMFALINADHYSPSTNKHLIDIRSALRDNMPYFDSPDPSDPAAAVKYLDNQAKLSLKTPLKRLKITNEQDIRWEFEQIHRAFKQANDLRAILGRVRIEIPIVAIHAVEDHLRKRLKRYHELNTPSEIARRSLEKSKRDEKKQAAEIARQTELITKFRQGSPVTIRTLMYDLLYVRDETVHTSRGATVPLEDAIRALKDIQSNDCNQDIKDKKIGHFALTFVDYMPDNPVIQVGCHKFLMSEAITVLKPHFETSRHLKIV